jgi:hypothetical protein
MRLRFWIALLLALLALVAFALGITTPPRSGPFCTEKCIVYPFTDATQFVPRDYTWLAPGTLLIPVFVIVAACIHARVEVSKRPLSLIALCFASMAAGIIGIDYFIQMQFVEPSLLRGEATGLGPFTQYDPHGVFIALEDLGYLALCVAFLFVGVAFPRNSRLARSIRWTFILAALVGFASFVGLTWRFWLALEYRFEVAIITVTWMSLLATGIMLAIFFRTAGHPGPEAL